MSELRPRKRIQPFIQHCRIMLDENFFCLFALPIQHFIQHSDIIFNKFILMTIMAERHPSHVYWIYFITWFFILRWRRYENKRKNQMLVKEARETRILHKLSLRIEDEGYAVFQRDIKGELWRFWKAAKQ